MYIIVYGIIPTNCFLDVKVEEAHEESIYQQLLDYDSSLSSHNRFEFLEFLFAKSKVYVAKWKSDSKDISEDTQQHKTGDIAGYAAISRIDQRILCLYANSEAIAEALVAQHLKESRAKNVNILKI